MGGGVPNVAAQIVVQADPFLAQWAILMAHDAMRWTFEGGCGLPIAALTWATGEFTPLKRCPKIMKRFIPLLAAVFGLPLAAFLSSRIPGVEVIEMAQAIMLTGGGGSIGIHETVNAGKKWRADRSGIRAPKSSPGSPGDTSSQGG